MFEVKNVHTRQASPEITQVKAMPFDLTLDSSLNTGIEITQESTSEISAIIVI